MQNGEKALNYSDIYLVPQYSELRSRSEADVSVKFLGRKFRSCAIPANMQSVINEDIAKWSSANDFAYIYHRFGDNRAFIARANREAWKLISISIGVKEGDKDLLRWAFANGMRIDWVCIDVAHGDHILVKEMISFIKGLSNSAFEIAPKIIAGNVSSMIGLCHLVKWGADAAKVGIAGGAACGTKHVTSFHVPMYSCVKNCSQEIFGGTTIPIIADGSIKENGDFARAIHAGARMVMAGSIFAACKDAPGESKYDKSYYDLKTIADNFYIQSEMKMPLIEEAMAKMMPISKSYHGSASAKQKGENKHVEGFEVELPCNGMTIAEKHNEIIESLQSAVSYAGGKVLADIRKAQYVTVK